MVCQVQVRELLALSNPYYFEVVPSNSTDSKYHQMWQQLHDPAGFKGVLLHYHSHTCHIHATYMCVAALATPPPPFFLSLPSFPLFPPFPPSSFPPLLPPYFIYTMHI
jgi:hypothetical protein